MAAQFLDVKEGAYASAIREPLGHSYQRGYKWPSHARGISFGVANNIEPDAAKKLIYPDKGSLEEKPEVRDMYKKTHGNWAPGEQRQRGYNWDEKRFGSDVKTQHTFGYGEKRLLNGAAMAVNPERFEEAYPKTVIVKKVVEDVKSVVNDQLGASKNLGQG